MQGYGWFDSILQITGNGTTAAWTNCLIIQFYLDFSLGGNQPIVAYITLKHHLIVGMVQKQKGDVLFSLC